MNCIVFKRNDLSQACFAAFLKIILKWIPISTLSVQEFVTTTGISQKNKYIFLDKEWLEIIGERDGVYGPKDESLLEFLDYIMKIFVDPGNFINLHFHRDSENEGKMAFNLSVKIEMFRFYHSDFLFILNMNKTSIETCYEKIKEIYIGFYGRNGLHPVNIYEWWFRFDYITSRMEKRN